MKTEKLQKELQRGMHKIVKTLEIALVFAGIFVFVYKFNSIDTKYGINKDVLNETLLLPLKYCVEKENENKNEQEYEKFIVKD